MSLIYCCCDGGGGTGHTLTGCPCTAIPDTIQVHVANPQDPALEPLVESGTLTWQAQPADFTGHIGADPAYWGPRLTTADGRYTYRNVVACGSSSLYVLTAAITDDSIFSPGVVQTIRFWSAATSGNACSPFTMVNGGPSTGFYSTQGITLSAP